MRCKFVLMIAKLLGVPIDVNASYWIKPSRE